jgi:thioredoxin-like negative regulator of GroEL
MKALKFYAPWCEPCKTLSRIIEGAGDRITTEIQEVNIEENTELTVQHRVRSVPVLVLLDDAGVEIKRHTGVLLEADLIEFLRG